MLDLTSTHQGRVDSSPLLSLQTYVASTHPPARLIGQSMNRPQSLPPSLTHSLTRALTHNLTGNSTTKTNRSFAPSRSLIPISDRLSPTNPLDWSLGHRPLAHSLPLPPVLAHSLAHSPTHPLTPPPPAHSLTLVQRRLAGPVGVPASDAVVSDGADAGAQAGSHRQRQRRAPTLADAVTALCSG